VGQVGRRRFLAALATLPAIPFSHAQQAQKVYRIGILQSDTSDVAGLSRSVSFVGTLLADHGYVRDSPFASPTKPGPVRKFDFVIRTAQAESELASLAAELVKLKVDVILAVGAQSTVALKGATGAIPIVMIMEGDPVRLGLVANLRQPGKNVTGVTALAPEMAVKRLELLREIVPGLTRVAVLWNPGDPEHADQWRATREAANGMKVELLSIEVAAAGGMQSVVSALRETDAGALVVFLDRFTANNAIGIIETAASRRLPSVFANRQFVNHEFGGLMSYGPDHIDLIRHAAKLIAQILDGARPNELPVEQPTRFELIVNAKTAKALGLTIPPSILLRANRILE